MRYTLFACTMLIALADRAAAQTALDLFPQDAAVGIAIRDLDDLIKKGDKFLTDSDIRVPLRPSELFDEGAKFLGVNKGLNRKAPAAILLMNPEKDSDFDRFGALNFLVPVLPFTDAKEMAGNFGISKTKFLLKSIHKTNRPQDELASYAMRHHNHIYLSGSDKILRRVQKSKPMAESLTAAQRKQFDDSDVLLHIGRYFFKFSAGGDTPDAFMHGSFPGDDPKEKEFAKQLITSLSEVENVIAGFRMHEGIDGHLLLTIPKDGEAAKLFKSMKHKHAPSTLKGLPEGNVLLAQASSGDTTHQALLTKMLFNFMLSELINRQGIVHHVDRLTYLGVFQEVLRHLQGNRLAIYQNTEEKRLGLFSAVAILDAEDAKLFLVGMRLLSKMATADKLDLTKKEVKDEINIERIVKDLGSSVYSVRQSATTKVDLIGEPALPYLEKAMVAQQNDLETKRRARELRDRISAVAAERRKELLSGKDRPLFLRPKLTFISNVEKRQGVSIDVVNIKIDGLEKVAKHQYTELLGPDWDKVRLAIVGNQIVVLLGSDTALFDAAISNLQKGDAGLLASKRLAVFHEQCSRDRLFEFHVSVEGAMRLVTPKAKRDTVPELTSVALTVGDLSLQVDARVPMPEVRTIARKAQELMQ